jgi:steroid delta-isomerase-like uncharacterized protein
MKPVASLVLVLALTGCASPPAAPDWGAQIRTANEELLNKGNLAYAREVFASNLVEHAAGQDQRGGPELVEGWVADLRKAFPDLRVEVEILATTVDRVAWVRTHRGTHQADFMGVPASGRIVTWQTMVVTRYEGGKVAEEWGVSDLGERLRVK